MGGMLGPEGDLLNPTEASCRQILIGAPVIDNDDLQKLIHVNDEKQFPGFNSVIIRGLYPVAEGGEGLRRALASIREQVSQAIEKGARLIVLSDRESDEKLAPIPSLLLTSAVHHHLVREKTRTKVGLLVEAGDAREVHHIAALCGFGAAVVNPYMAFESIDELLQNGDLPEGMTLDKAIANYIKAASKGVLKVMSKMGISTLASYTGAQLFQVIGLSQELVDEYFTGLQSQLGGVGLDEIAADVAARHRTAFLDRQSERAHRELEVGGEYQWRREGEYHLFNPDTVFKLQHATRTGQYSIFKEYTKLVDDQSERLASLRGLFEFKKGVRPPVPLDEVESASEIVKRFSTGAMSYGSISAEAHETLAIAMNRLGGRSNSGEGGEHPSRFTPDENGDWRRSAIKQVASGRFGVTAHYLSNCTDIQIKMAQGAKPGEGGQLPPHKVYPWVAEVRGSTPGVGLISPPPHHDIYSIEDLAQLIHDLKNANPKARIHVKLVSELGVGTVAAGVSKAHADVVLISGHDGGTGASPLTSLKHAGAPWEIGLAETQQTLMLNGLRDRIVVQVDGQMKTGRDVVVAALLGAEEYGFATAPLVVSGCIMMRVCHLDTCPVGVATQNPVLRKRFTGKPEFVENFMLYIAEEVREYLAELGFRSLDEAIGQVDVLDTRKAVEHYRASKLDLSPLLEKVTSPIYGEQDMHCTKEQYHALDKALDNELIAKAQPALESGTPVSFDTPITNVNRTVGTMLGHELTKKYGAEGLPDNTIDITFTGSAGNSFGAFVPRGITMRLNGDANDFVGKGLSGGRIIVRPPHNAAEGFVPEDNIIAGNVILFGATSGEVLIRGIAGERFAVRNSGATAVVEGVGDHGCEYMTGGKVVILGKTGRNFGAGMSGGVAFVYNPDKDFENNLNTELVDLEDLEGEDFAWLKGAVERHRDETGSEVAARILADWSQQVSHFAKVMPRDYKKVLMLSRTPPSVVRTWTRRSWSCSWLIPPVSSSTVPARRRSAGPSRCDSSTGRRSTSRSRSTPSGPRQAVAWTAVSPSATTVARSGISSPSGTTSPTRQVGGRDRASPRHEQLPRVHRPALPGALRGVVRARHQPGPGDHQAGRGRAGREGLRRRPRQAGSAVEAHRPQGRGRRFRARGPRCGTAAHACRSLRDGVRAGRPHRWSAPIRHPRVQDGEALHRPPSRADGGRGHRLQAGRERGCRHHRRRAARAVRRRGARRRRDRRPRPADPRTRTRRHPPGDGIPADRQPRAARRPAGPDHHGRG